ncbi:MAG TPA: hypothetical protein VJZ49_00785 [Syntrophales bacterium]|nr:hypothetical protein [Syntrophales bacterium]
MTILPYHIDNVISAYNKQSRMKIKQPSPQETPAGEKDVVMLSQKGIDKAEAYKKISSNLVDAILKNKE